MLANFPPTLERSFEEKKQTNKINHSTYHSSVLAAGDSQPQQMRFLPTLGTYILGINVTEIGSKSSRPIQNHLLILTANSFDIVDG